MPSMESLIVGTAWYLLTLAGIWKLNDETLNKMRSAFEQEMSASRSCLGQRFGVLCLDPLSVAIGLVTGALGMCVCLILLRSCCRDRTYSWLVDAAAGRQAVLDDEKSICLSVSARHVPQMTRRSHYVKVSVQARVKGASVLAEEEVPLKQKLIALPLTGTRNVSVDDVDLLFVMSLMTRWSSREIGRCCVPLVDLVHQHQDELQENLLLCDHMGNAILDTKRPYWPCELSVSLAPRFLPISWREACANPAPGVEKDSTSPVPRHFPRHIFMMARGTRGDVQPFVALARGMAEQQGWLVTICTEYAWRDLVQDNSVVSSGKILFRPSGGDTMKRTSGAMEQWAMKQKTELMQMLMLANSEAEFLPSATVIIHQIKEIERAMQPVDLLIFGFTLTGVGMLASECCRRPVAGFFLQPSCIPSKDPEWTALESIDSHSLPLIDKLEEHACTHKTLQRVKAFVEHNPFGNWSIDQIRGWFDLPPAKTWKIVRRNSIPIVIPMKEGTFKLPSDWHPGIPPGHLERGSTFNIWMTDFIFLRKGEQSSSMGKPLEDFITEARKDRYAKLCLMTVSSMPIKRETVVECSAKMLDADRHLRLIYVGKKESQPLPNSDRIIEVERADFGLLFKHMDAFIVHGGLGTTVEALRMKKPVCVTGPLLLDQRFWGEVCHRKGVGPPPVHIDDFPNHCVDFIHGAVDARDRKGWQKNAVEQDWGDVSDDGVQANLDCFNGILDQHPGYVQTVSRHFLWFLQARAKVKWVFSAGMYLCILTFLVFNIGLVLYYLKYLFDAWFKWTPSF